MASGLWTWARSVLPAKTLYVLTEIVQVLVLPTVHLRNSKSIDESHKGPRKWCEARHDYHLG